jgi:hypothetical protein
VRPHPDLTPDELRSRVWDVPGKRADLHIFVSKLNTLLASAGLEVRSVGGVYQIRAVS